MWFLLRFQHIFTQNWYHLLQGNFVCIRQEYTRKSINDKIISIVRVINFSQIQIVNRLYFVR